MFGSFLPSLLVGSHHQSLLGPGSRHCYGINYTQNPKPRKPRVGRNQYTMVDDMSGSTPLSVPGQGWSWAEIALDMGVGLGTVHRAGQMPRGS
jgi:hypothetical protein